MTDDELVWKVAQHIEAAFDERIAVYWKIIGPAALAIARPVIEREALEKATLVARNQQCDFVEDDFSEGYNEGCIDTESSLRALMEQSK
ncbi:MAG: hypothetical protein WC026_17350 [Hyphomicrobium sp.]|uniref:hypothetical protein n=1 Tax=Hyphomicrobium sp. TaxID=82 RepID=UPI0035655196